MSNVNLPEPLCGAFPKRPIDANKRTIGTVCVIGGSAKYVNAPVIAALGSRAAGAGLVHLVVPDASRIPAGSLVPEATFSKLTPTFVPPRADVYVAGMGLGVSVSSEAAVSRLISGASGRFVLDADALAVLALWYGKKGGHAPAKDQQIVLTPHVGEAAKLLGCAPEAIYADRLGAAKEIAGRYSATVVLKSERTIVVSRDLGKTYENRAGNPFMALGGMGDLLAGAIGARWAYLKGEPFLAASSAVWLHSAASDLLVSDFADPSVANTAARMGSLRVRMEVKGA